MKKCHKILLAMCLLPVTTAWAYVSENFCGYLKVQIGNGTKHICQLLSTGSVHGNLIEPPPATLFPGQSKTFLVNQTLYGPHITLTYKCGHNVIDITSQQNFCFWEAGDISAYLSQSSPTNIHVTHVKQSGSYYWSTPGMISWVFSQIDD